MKSLIKLYAADFYQYGLKSGNDDNCAILKSLYKDGISFTGIKISDEQIEKLLNVADNVFAKYQNRVSRESNDSDSRIYGFDQYIDEDLKKSLLDKYIPYAEKFYGTKDLKYFLMYGNIKYKSDGLGSGSGWHRDSPFRHQFKAIVYLTDVDSRNGPFEYISGSHSRTSIIRDNKILNLDYSVDRFSDDNAKIISLEPLRCISKRGNVIFVDTRGLHRGSPLLEGERKALTLYIFAHKIPTHFNELLK